MQEFILRCRNKSKTAEEWSELVQLYWIIALFFALVVSVFAVQNAEAVNIRFLLWQFQNISLVLVILGSAAVGAFLLFALGTMKQLSMALKLRDAENKIRKLESELKKLREVSESAEKEQQAINSQDNEELKDIS